MAGQRTLQCMFRPIDKEEMQASVEREFAMLERRLELDFLTCHLNSCNFGQNHNINLFILGKQSQEFPKNLGALVNNYFLPKLLVTYGIDWMHKDYMHKGYKHNNYR